MHLPQQRLASLLLCLLLTLNSSVSYAHGTDILSAHPLDWRTSQISQVFSSSPFSINSKHPRIDKLAGKTCMTGSFINIDVDNDYAFDIDETVTVEVEFDLERSAKEIILNYDKNGGFTGTKTLTLPDKSDGRWYRHTFTLARARFAERIVRHVNLSGDFAIGGAKHIYADTLSICDIRIKRSHTTPQPTAYGRLNLSLSSEGQLSPARIGIYDATGRMPLPAKQAIPLTYRSLVSRSIITPPDMAWPVDNRYGFYINGEYETTLPVGSYELVISRGPEYRIIRETFDIKPDRETRLKQTILPWEKMPAKGWYSGDVHIHYGRSNLKEHHNIRVQMQAEDLHIANLLQMDDIGTVDFHQYSWGKESYDNQALYALVSGQEGPRSHRGHTIQLNIDHPLHHADEYYLYHNNFKEIHKQGGVTGYAHVRSHYGFGSLFGLALDAPFDLVDFVEIFQFSTLDLAIWFDFLNMGYALAPAAGSDTSPLNAGLPGNVRSYVNMQENYSVQGWFDGLKAGHTFVSNGPMLEFAVNGESMGSTLQLSKGQTLTVAASASLNPDLGRLVKLELFQQGKVIASTLSEKGVQSMELHHELQANQGSWLVIKASAEPEPNVVKSKLFAATAPVYIKVDGQGFCEPSQVPAIAEKLKREMKTLLASVDEANDHYVFPYAKQLRQTIWPKNLPVLEQRMQQAAERYDKAIGLAESGGCLEW